MSTDRTVEGRIPFEGYGGVTGSPTGSIERFCLDYLSNSGACVSHLTSVAHVH